MAETIAVDEESAHAFAQEIQADLAGYTRFSLHTLCGNLSFSVGGEHDGLNGSMKSGLDTWSELVASDAKALISTAKEIAAVDANLAKALLGIGSFA